MHSKNVLSVRRTLTILRWHTHTFSFSFFCFFVFLFLLLRRCCHYFFLFFFAWRDVAEVARTTFLPFFILCCSNASCPSCSSCFSPFRSCSA
jgi:hypothetical protein